MNPIRAALRGLLTSRKYKFRSVSALAASTGLSEDEVRNQLDNDPAVRRNRSRSGTESYALIERVGD